MFKKLVFLAAAVAATGALLGAGTAAADPTIAIGGGSGIIIDDRFECTVTTIGNDGAGRLVGITAGHCGVPGSVVKSEANPRLGTIGRFASSVESLDYAVIEFDRGKVIPVNRVGNATITGIGTPAAFPNIICKEGRTTGHTCGVSYGDVFGSGVETWSQMCVIEGDSGAPVVLGSTLVGMVNAYLLTPCIGPEVGTNMTTILDDINARGGVGAGFWPI